VRVAYPKSALEVRYSRSGGPGGQNVNKVETKAEVRLALSDLDVPPHVRDRIAARLASRLTADGRIVLTSSKHRLRSHNLRDCLERLDALLAEAARPPVERVATKPTRGSRERNRAAKQRRSRKKRDRRRPDED
jgi:ribosome-associated protein